MIATAVDHSSAGLLTDRKGACKGIVGEVSEEHCAQLVSVVVFLPMLWRGARWLLGDPGGRPGPGREGFGALAGRVAFGRRWRNPRRTRAGVRRLGLRAGFSQGRRRSSARWRARWSGVCAAMINQVQRSAAWGVRIRGRVQPSVCLRNRNVCSMSTRRRDACQSRSTSVGASSGREHHSQTGVG